ncbi:TetR/AcrR family transcriptional regulator [Caulobacter sp.]|uniref:TetR/AcrR family transcriptional regulator n=1 Tax=Caulobacter sp. TaxID=78 RepID=UPI003BB20DF4
MFHARGYDGVGVAEIAQALGVSPPSFYAAFGGKAAFFETVLRAYDATDGLPLDDILAPGRPVGEALTDLLRQSAERYATQGDASGCMVIEGRHSNDPEACAAADRLGEAAAERIRAFIAITDPERAQALADYVVAAMTGLSSAARSGLDTTRLRAIADLASRAFA